LGDKGLESCEGREFLEGGDLPIALNLKSRGKGFKNVALGTLISEYVKHLEMQHCRVAIGGRFSSGKGNQMGRSKVEKTEKKSLKRGYEFVELIEWIPDLYSFDS
jgi:hypothetical protein